MLCAKFGWHWVNGSGEEDFYISSMYFHYFVIISPWKKGRFLHLKKLESPSPKDALWQVWLKLTQWFMRRRWKCEKFTDRQTDGQTDGRTYNDGRQVIRKAHLSFQLRWANKRTVQNVIHIKKSTYKQQLYIWNIILVQVQHQSVYICAICIHPNCLRHVIYTQSVYL